MKKTYDVATIEILSAQVPDPITTSGEFTGDDHIISSTVIEEEN